MRFLRLVAVLVVMISGLSSAVFASASSWQDWVEDGAVDDGVLGRIWSVRDQTFLPPSELLGRLSGVRYLLLGEVHDNAVHHQLQAFLLKNVDPDRRPTLVMEMVSADRSEALEKFNETSDPTADDFAKLVEWKNSGWPDFELYRPIMEAALARGADIAPGLPAQADTRAVSRGGLNELSADRRRKLGLDTPLAPEFSSGLEEEIIRSHCDMLPPEMVPNMMAVQRFRDAALAEAMRQTPEDGPAVLIAGNGHVRSDRGVPVFLSPDNKRTAVVILEEVDAAAEPANTLADYGSDFPADYVWFTSSKEREDPCQSLRERFAKPKPEK